MEKEEEKEVLFYMPKSLKTELAILAAREGKSIKEIMNEITAEYVKVHKEGNPQHLITKFSENEDFTGFPSMAIDYSKKKTWIEKYCNEDGRLNELGKELWGHVLQWKIELQKL